MVATASSAAADISSHVESVHPQFSATTEPVHNSVGVAVRLGSDGSTGNRSESPTSEEPEENCAPMDLSSGGGGVASQAMIAATPTFMQAMAAAAVANNSGTPTSLADSLLNARRLAEFVRAQQLRNEETRDATPKIHENSPPPMVPRKRAWPELQLDLSAMVSEKLKKKNQTENQIEQSHENSGGPTSPGTESNSSGGGSSATPTNCANKEVKKRRLDQLLSKKFSVNDSPPPQPPLPCAPIQAPEIQHLLSATPPFNEGEAAVAAAKQQMMRRDSSEKKQNRRKRSSPQSSIAASPVTLSLRPNSELFHQAHQPKSEIPKIPENSENATAAAGDLASENHHQNNVPTESKNSLKNQLLQMHLAQAALLNQTSSNLFPGFPGLPGVPPGPPSSGNPLLYYGYYAQMIQGLQSQQQKLLEQLTGKNAAKNILSSTPIPTKVRNLTNFDGFF